MHNKNLVIYVTAPSLEVGKKLAEGLVSEQLAACVNLVPNVESVYKWEGQIQSDKEILMIIKTKESLFLDINAFIQKNHPYEVPEVIGLPIVHGSDLYLEWIAKETRAKK